MLRIVLSRDNLEGFYNPRMSKLIENSQIFAKMFESHLPVLSKHLLASKIDPLLYPQFIKFFYLIRDCVDMLPHGGCVLLLEFRIGIL